MELHRIALSAGVALALACGSSEEAPAPAPPPEAPPPAARPTAPPAPAGLPAAPAAAADLPHGLLLALSTFGRTPDGKPLPRSELVILTREGGVWKTESFEDPDSNVFHKAMVYTPPGAEPAILTLGGTRAILKLWRRGDSGFEATPIWEDDFGGKWSRMRDAEVAALFGDDAAVLAVATHDQGVVATVRPKDGGFEVERIDEEKNTFVHEIEVGDLDGDGVLEVYATPSEPNKLDGTPQPGKVVRYVPAAGEGRVVVADLGDRHAKEILVSDVDGDGRDELYVSVEAVEGGDLEIRRYDAGTDPTAGEVIATLDDTMCRFLTAGDLDGDGKREMVAAAKDTGLWLLRPGATWSVESIDRDSKGFEHAALLTDLDGDGTDELYVSSDDDRELRRYVMVDGGFTREVIYKRSDPSPLFTWNLMPVPLEVVK
jgi:hypothetical protein